MNQPVMISFVVPAYNEEKSLGKNADRDRR